MRFLNLLFTAFFIIISSGFILAQNCTADASISQTGTPGEVQIIDNSTTSSGAAATYSWVDLYFTSSSSWDYEGTVYLQPNSNTATYQVPQNGTYTYYISVQDSITNCFDSISGTFTINNLPSICDANFTFDNVVNNVVDFTADSYSNYLNYHWDFGNGSSTYGANSSHTYVNPGTYNVCLTVSDNSGNSNCIETICQTVVIDTNDCIISADYSYTHLGNGVYDFAINNVTPNTIYHWSIGSQNYSGTSTTHTFQSNGQINATVIATDTTIPTCQDTVIYPINVTDADTCNYDASFSYVDTTNNEIAFSPDTYDSSLEYHWDFGDGNYSNNAYPFHEYANSGTYTACLTVWESGSNGNCADTVCQTVVVTQNNCNYTADFTSHDTLNNETAFFPDSYDPNLNYWWDFGDGNSSSDIYPYHTYANPGTYNVCLMVWENGNSSCADTVCETVVVPQSTCEAEFYLFQDSTNSTMYYAWNLSTGNNLNYQWNFGDGNYSNQQYPTHTYSTPGNYSICLTVTNSNGTCTDSYCDSIEILNKASGTTINVLPEGETADLDNEETTRNQVSLYPNPASSVISLSIESNKNGQYEYQVLDVTGKVIANNSFSISSGMNKEEINIDHIRQGVYFVQIQNQQSGEHIETIKFIKK